MQPARSRCRVSACLDELEQRGQQDHRHIELHFGICIASMSRHLQLALTSRALDVLALESLGLELGYWIEAS